MAAYREAVLASNPTAYYRLGETTGGARSEVDGTGAQKLTVDGTYVNGGGLLRGQAAPIAHTADKAVFFGGAGDSVSIPDQVPVDLGDVFTVEFWIRRNAGLGLAAAILSKGANSLGVSFGTDNKIHAFKSGSADFVKSTSTITSLSNWNHVAVVKNGATRSIYINGVDRSDTSGLANQTLTDNSSALVLGAGAIGWLDEVAIYKTPLPASTILAHYQAGITLGPYPDVVVEMALDSNPMDATYLWRNYSEYVRSYDWSRGRQQELDQVQAGTASVTLKNQRSEFDCENTTSPYNGTLLPRKPVRISLDWYGVRYPRFTGYIEEWPPAESPQPYSEVTVEASDGLAILAQGSFPDPGAPILMGTFNNASPQTFTDGSSFSAPNYARKVWAQVVADWWAEDTTVFLHYTNQAGAGDLSLGPRQATVNVPNGALASVGTRLEVTLADGDTGLRDIVGAFSNTLASGRVAIYAQQETYPVQKAGTRCGAMLDAIGWPAALRNIETGWSDIQGFTPEPEEQPLGRIQAAADAELGSFFFDAQGRATFHDRHHRWYTTAVKAPFSDVDAAGVLAYVDLAREGKSYKRVKNDIRITIDGAGSPAAYFVTASITAYGRIQYAATVPLTTRAEAQNMALQIGNWYAQPASRFTSVAIVPDNTTRNQVKLQKGFALEFGDRVTVVRTPAGGLKFTKQCFVEGIAEAWAANPRTLKTTFQLSPEVVNPFY